MPNPLSKGKASTIVKASLTSLEAMYYPCLTPGSESSWQPLGASYSAASKLDLMLRGAQTAFGELGDTVAKHFKFIVI